MGYFQNVSLPSRVPASCFEALSIALASAECEMRGLSAPDAWVAVHEEAMSFAQLGFDFRTHLLPLLEVAVLVRVYVESS